MVETTARVFPNFNFLLKNTVIGRPIKEIIAAIIT